MADAIVWDEVSGDSVFVDYQPGDCTRYLCQISNLFLTPRALMTLGFGADEPDGVFEFAWLSRSRGGVCCVLRDAGFLHASYLAEKLGVNMASAGVLAELIAHYTKVTADSTSGLPGETEPRPCPACGGRGNLGDGINASLPCPECGGEGVQRLST